MAFIYFLCCSAMYDLLDKSIADSNYFSMLCCQGMENLGLHEEELTNIKLNAALEHSVTHTYPKGEMTIRPMRK
jgi:hypothetical protein